MDFRKRCLMIASLIGIISLAGLIILAVNANKPQLFYDYIIELPAIIGFNKSIEMQVLWIIILLGIAIFSAFTYFFVRIRPLNRISSLTKRNTAHLLCMAIIGWLFLYFLIYRHPFNWLFLIIAVVGLIAWKWKEERMLFAMITPLFSYYGILGILNLLLFIIPYPLYFKMKWILIGVFFISIILLFLKKDYFQRCILLSQTAIPLNLIVLLNYRYIYHGETLNLLPPWQSICAISLFYLYFFISALKHLNRYWQQSNLALDKIITLGTCILFYTMGSFITNGKIIMDDTHHPIENIIGFSQIFELGQIPFQQYIPISGMYSIFHGFFVWLFGNDALANYSISTNILYLCIGAITFFLLRNLLPISSCFFIAVFFEISTYNRIWLALPISLFLLQPFLWKRHTLWISSYLLTSYLHGLYYPLFGAAVCFGFFPAAIYHLSQVRKESIQKRDITVLILAIVLVGIGIPLMMSMAKHIIAMSSQSILGSGMSIFGQAIPPNFFKDIPSIEIRIILYDILRFILPAAIVWIGACLFVKGVYQYFQNNKWESELFLGIFLILFSIISYTYTFVRMDIFSILARNSAPIAVSVILIAVVLLRKNKQVDNLSLLFLFFLLVVYSTFSNVRLPWQDGNRFNEYHVDNSYILTDASYRQLGDGFIKKSVYDALFENGDIIKNENKSTFSIGYFGKNYVLNAPGDAEIEALEIKGLPATKETISNLKDNHPIIGRAFIPEMQYYLYYWLMTSGDYHYNKDKKLFYWGNQSIHDNKIADIAPPVYDVGRIGGTTAASWETLEGIFEKINSVYTIDDSLDKEKQIHFDETLDGNLADFMYLDISTDKNSVTYGLYDLEKFHPYSNPSFLGKCFMQRRYNFGKKVQISWQDDDGNTFSIRTALDEGKLLIPLGMGRRWLLHNHSSIQIYILDSNENKLEVPTIKKIQMLKLRAI